MLPFARVHTVFSGSVTNCTQRENNTFALPVPFACNVKNKNKPFLVPSSHGLFLYDRLTLFWKTLLGDLNMDLTPGITNRFLHRKCPVRIFIHESENFRKERVSVANE